MLEGYFFLMCFEIFLFSFFDDISKFIIEFLGSFWNKERGSGLYRVLESVDVVEV